MDTNQPLYPIREVSRITGVNSITLRAWERRYGLIEPVRTPSGHRLYTDEHIQQIQTAVSLNQQGIPISRVKTLLEKPAEIDSTETNVDASTTPQLSEGGSAFLIEPLQALNIMGLEQAFDQLLADFPDKKAYQILVQANLQFSEWTLAQQLLWQSLLSIRLKTRLRHQLRLFPKHRANRVLLVNASQQMNRVSLDLLRLYYAMNGCLTIEVQRDELGADLSVLANLLKTFEAQTLSLLTEQAMPDEPLWVDWSERYSALEMHIWWQANEPVELAAFVQNQSYALDTLFTGR
ncbi:MerR family transcriptional regulator [Thiomicrorhabdus indica]|uniref:MerR family transcriptional regulator n=1 Tax=Thiomicrorhabdus indica TaxID=2267253 RepID=UPI00102DB7E4|nr:MerR family transcriptional regulator [Thiomicrorhabdus indica]